MSSVDNRLGPWAVAGWVAAAAAVRLAALALAGPGLPCAFDECSYLRLGRELVAGSGFVTEKGFLWPPGYTLFMALLAPDTGNGAPLARTAQALLAALLVWPVCRLGERAATGTGVAARRVGHAACAWVAFDPTLVAYAHLLWPESLFLLLLAPALLVVTSPRATSRGAVGLAAGALFGVAGLVKAVGVWLGIAVALAVPDKGAGRRRCMALGGVVLGAVLVLAPWILRNARAYGRFVPIDATAGTNLYIGNNDSGPVTWDWGAVERTRVRNGRPRCTDADFVSRDRCEQRRALEWIASHPGTFARRAFTKWADLLHPTSFLVRHVRAGRYTGEPMAAIPRRRAAFFTALAALPFMAMSVLAMLGVAGAPPSPLRRATLGMTVALLAITALTFGMSRLRLPLAPLAAAYAALGGCLLLHGRALPAGRAARVALGAALLALVLLWAARLPALVDFDPPPFGTRTPEEGVSPILEPDEPPASIPSAEGA